MPMSNDSAKDIINSAEKTLKELGFVFTFICGAHFDEKEQLNIPFIINFDEELLAEFLYKFLNLEEYKELKTSLLSKYSLVNSEKMEDFVKFVKL